MSETVVFLTDKDKAVLDSQIQQNSANVSKNASDIASIQNSVRQHSALVTKNSNDIAELSKKVSTDLSAIGKNTSDIAALTSEVQKNTSDIASVSAELQRNKEADNNNFSQLSDRVQSNFEQIAELSEDVSINTRNISDLSAGVQRHSSEIASNSGRINSLDESVNRNSASIAEIQSEVNENSDQLASISGSMTDAISDIERIEDNVDTLFSSVNGLGAEDISLQNQITQANGRINQNTTDIAANREDINTNTRDISALQTDSEKHFSDFGANSTRISNLEKSVKQITTDVNTHSDSIAKNTEDIAGNAEGVAENASSIDSLWSSLSSVRGSINQHEKEIYNLKLDAQMGAASLIATASGPVCSTDISVENRLSAIRFYGKTTLDSSGRFVSVGNLKGSSFTIDVWSRGKNLLPTNSVDGSQDATGHVQLNYLPPGEYVLSANITKFENDTATNTRIGCKVVYTDGSYEDFNGDIDNANAERDGISRKKQTFITVRADKTISYINIWLLDYSELPGARNAKAENAQLEFGSTATAYEPYKDGGSVTVTIQTGQGTDIPDGLPGLPVASGGNYTDENGQQWIADVLDLSRWTRVKRIGVAFLSTFPNQEVTSAGGLCYVDYPEIAFDPFHMNSFMCDDLPVVLDENAGWTSTTPCVSVAGNVIRVYSEVGKYIAPTLYYVLAEPVEEQMLIVSGDTFAYVKMTSQYPNSTFYNNADAYMEVDYYADVTGYIDKENAANVKEMEQAVVEVSTPPIIPTATGEVVTISDSAHRPLAGLKLYGKTTQATTTGKNILPDGGEERTGDFILYPVAEVFEGSEGETVSVSFDLYSPDGSAVSIYAYQESGLSISNGYDFMPGANAYARYSFATTIFKYEQTLNTGNVIFYSPSGATLKVKNVQIEFGSTATSYEPYTGGIPSPNPNYPQPLANVGAGGNIRAYVQGKNLFSGAEEITFVTRSAYMKLDCPLAPGTYTVSALVTSTDTDATGCWIGFMKGNEDGTIAYALVGRNTRKAATITLSRPVSEVFLNASTTYAASEGDTATWKQVQIELGTSATEYEPYKGSSLTASTPNGLPGIKVSSGGNYTDENGQQWVCDEKDYERGVYVQRIQKLVFDGVTDGHKFNSSDSSTGETAYISKRYLPAEGKPGSLAYTNMATSVRIATAGPIVVGLPTSFTGASASDSSETITSKFNAACATLHAAGTPLEILYQITTPVETPIPESEMAAYRAMKSWYPNTTVYNDSGAGMAVDYIADTKNYIDQKLAAISAALLNK